MCNFFYFEVVALILSIILGCLALRECYNSRNCHIHARVLIFCIMVDIIMSDVGEIFHSYFIGCKKLNHDELFLELTHLLFLSGNINSSFVCTLLILEQIIGTKYSKVYEKLNQKWLLIVIHIISFVIFCLLSYILENEFIAIYIELISLFIAIILCLILYFYSIKKKNGVIFLKPNVTSNRLLSQKYILNQIKKISKKMIPFILIFLLHSLVNVIISTLTHFSKFPEYETNIYTIIIKINFVSRNMFTPIFLVFFFSPKYLKISFCWCKFNNNNTQAKTVVIKTINECHLYFNQLKQQWK
ncbi:7TM GPCR, serpentine receptor class e (Sre) family-containing protein [Strongyloides ratti]|uniref:7TM GPCR, serpentine receptor class e (Sre) family-containing protein n=1 Tax=Strongyloides ratti TaxID=34506 RepID=A0A090LKS4_STRRB|nr:7TM GPCR, serpentine receptor class e (Sre) family-containing protein [Strongyloides ratti]CEF70308.1 7TM GPCR, serpentine receptor class e (Sre) family-containing protein [Strongyloides ratti]